MTGRRAVRQRILLRMRRAMADEPPALRLRFWDGDSFDFVPDPSVTITFRTPAAMRPLLFGRIHKLGDAYVKGDLVVDGPVEAVIAIGIRIAERIGRTPLISRLARPVGWLASRHTRRKDADCIRHHYDVSNEFYALWLDREMVYSCAYFHDGSEDIHRAQAQRKLCHLPFAICHPRRLRASVVEFLSTAATPSGKSRAPRAVPARCSTISISPTRPRRWRP